MCRGGLQRSSWPTTIFTDAKALSTVFNLKCIEGILKQPSHNQQLYKEQKPLRPCALSPSLVCWSCIMC
uniref:Uncharacterized protein n=1 Tax=Prolemur simus TaxID=1328070 RepID=A0A8C8YII4_PROSS